jgi:hypothetical protein
MGCVQWYWKGERMRTIAISYTTDIAYWHDMKGRRRRENPRQSLWGWRREWRETSVGCEAKQNVNRQKRFKETGEENRCGHTLFCAMCVWKNRTESPLAEGVNKTWQILAYRETLAEINIGNFTAIKSVISVKTYLKSGRASRRKVIRTQTNEWVEQYWWIIQKMEINKNGIYASAYRKRQASDNVIRKVSSVYRVWVTWELWRSCGKVGVC